MQMLQNRFEPFFNRVCVRITYSNISACQASALHEAAELPRCRFFPVETQRRAEVCQRMNKAVSLVNMR